MDIQKFKQHLDNSLELLLDITRQHCYNDISETLKFIIQPSGNDIHDGMNEFEAKNLTVLNRLKNKLLTIDKVVELLCHDNKVPLWINVTVYESRSNMTIVHFFVVGD